MRRVELADAKGALADYARAAFDPERVVGAVSAAA